MFNTIFWLQSEAIIHERSVYGSLDLLGDLGGVTEVVMLVFGFLLFPISEHSFTLKAAKKMFKARTAELGLFNPPSQAVLDKEPEDFEKKLTLKQTAEIKKHHEIRVKYFDGVRLYIANCMGCFFPTFCWSNVTKFQQIYNETGDKIETELNIIKIIKNLKDIKILMKYSLLTKELKHQIRHSEKYLIDLDAEIEEEPDESDIETSLSFIEEEI